MNRAEFPDPSTSLEIAAMTLYELLLLAQAAPQKPAAEGFARLFEGPWFLMILITTMLYLMVLRPQRKDQNTRATMLAGLKKNDAVLTSAGIFGRVVQAPPGAEEITIRIDDNANIRMRILRSSVVRVLGAEGARSENNTETVTPT